MGEVFLAHDPQLDRRVLILLPAHLAGDGLARDRLRREALADSYGGVVVSEAGNHPKVTALVHIKAFAPDKCESVSSLIANPAPGAPVHPILFLDRENFAASFAADVRPDLAAFMGDSQVPWGVEALQGVVSEPAWRSKPSWYLVATDDKMIPPAAQRAMAGRAGCEVTEAPGSHAIYVSNPEAVAAVIKPATLGAAAPVHRCEASRLALRAGPTGAWQKMRINRGQEFVIGGYVPSGRNFDTLIFGYYDETGRLMFAAKTRNGFTPASRDQVFQRLERIQTTATCPFANLPEKKPGRWGQGITSDRMAECVWHLRHSKFIRLRDDKRAKDVRRE
jgi:hypothetical protein